MEIDETGYNWMDIDETGYNWIQLTAIPFYTFHYIVPTAACRYSRISIGNEDVQITNLIYSDSLPIPFQELWQILLRCSVLT